MSEETRKKHWEQVYTSKSQTEVSWFQPKAADSLEIIRSTDIDPATAKIIDAGGGASVLVDDLLNAGFRDITVVDIAGTALQASRERLGADRSHLVTWIESDITEFRPPAGRKYDVWHDRAVFHFLTSPEDRMRYVEVVTRSLVPGGYVVMATFALEGPNRCSGLDVLRYSPELLLAEFGTEWKLVSSRTVVHQTPWQAEQVFIYCILTRAGSDTYVTNSGTQDSFHIS